MESNGGAIQGQKLGKVILSLPRSKNFLPLPNLRKRQEKRKKKQGQKRGKVKIIFVLDNMLKSFQDHKDKNFIPIGRGRLFDLAAVPTRGRPAKGGSRADRTTAPAANLEEQHQTLCARSTVEGRGNLDNGGQTMKQGSKTFEQRRAEYLARFGAAQTAAFDRYLEGLSKYQARHNEAAHALEILTREGGPWYQIPLEDCQDYRELLDWIRHLSDKTWFKVHHLSPLLRAWEKATGKEI